MRQKHRWQQSVAAATIAVALLYWIAESFLHWWLFGPVSYSPLVPWDSHEWYSRLLMVGLLMVFGAYAQVTVNRARSSERRLAALESAVENADEGVLITQGGSDPSDQAVIYVNQGASGMLGRPRERLIGMRPDALWAPGDGEPEVLRRALYTGVSFVGEIVSLRPDDSEFVSEWKVTPIGNDESPRWLYVLRDVSERRRTESMLKGIREEERRRIARDLHDDVLQDLTEVYYSTQVLQLRLRDPDSKSELTEKIQVLKRVVERLRAVIEGMRREGPAEGKPIPELLRSVIEVNRRKAPGMEIHLDIDEAFPRDVAGPRGLEVLRVVQEALVNVRRHAGARSVWVSLEAPNNLVRAEISDDGRGFDPEIRWRGIGMSAMEERATRLGGWLEVWSEPGRGTSVALTVPLASLNAGVGEAVTAPPAHRPVDVPRHPRG